MSKIVVSVIGLDCPGVVYAVSSTLSALECNIEEVSQTILKNQFAAIFVANKQESLDNGKSVSRVRIPLSPLNLKFSQNFSFFSQKFFS